MLERVITVFKDWHSFAAEAGVDEGHIRRIQNMLLLDL